MKDCYRGDVFAPIDERAVWKEKLERCGMVVCEYDTKNEMFENCIISFEDFPKIEPYWGTIYWNLYPHRTD